MSPCVWFISVLEPKWYVRVSSLVQLLSRVRLFATPWTTAPRDRTQVSLVAGRFFTSWATREALSDSRTPTIQDQVILPNITRGINHLRLGWGASLVRNRKIKAFNLGEWQGLIAHQQEVSRKEMWTPLRESSHFARLPHFYFSYSLLLWSLLQMTV